MSSQKDKEKQTKPAVSRRGFLGGASVGGGLLATSLAVQEADAQAAGKLSGLGEVAITLNINGKPTNLAVEPRVTLLDALRHKLDLTGAKRVCDRGTCGACTIMVNGKTVYGCSVLAIDAVGKQIATIESLGGPGKLHPVSAAFVKHDAQQCGYCTPGFVMAAKAFLDKNPNPTREQVQKGLSGNICRCGTYVGMREAVLEASRSMRNA